MHDPKALASQPRRRRLLSVGLATVAVAALLAGLSSSILAPAHAPVPAPAAVASLAPEPVQEPVQEAIHVDATADRAEAPAFPAPDALRSALNQPLPAEVTDATLPTPFAQQDPLPEPARPDTAEAPATPQAAPQTVPLPVARPSEFRSTDARVATRRAERAARRARTAAVAPAQAEDERNFFEKFFGIERKPAPALAYAALESNGAIEAIPRRPPIAPAPSPIPPPAASGSGTAIYDISARTVTLPNGERLEAHSGLGAYMDDPRYVDQKMRGATPPGTYDLTEREALFHGVRAIRLTPVGGPGAIYNRAGLLAHTYMLGPHGASNGCVSFRDYNRFLQAYLGGQVQRLVVVAGSRGSDPISAIFASR